MLIQFSSIVLIKVYIATFFQVNPNKSAFLVKYANAHTLSGLEILFSFCILQNFIDFKLNLVIVSIEKC